MVANPLSFIIDMSVTVAVLTLGYFVTRRILMSSKPIRRSTPHKSGDKPSPDQKTVQDWLVNNLTQKMYERAVDNIFKQNSSPRLVLNAPARSFYGAMQVAFDWSVSPEGHDYWATVCETLKPEGE